MLKKLSPTPLVVDPLTPRPRSSFVPPHLERKISARWRWWEPLVCLDFCRRQHDSASAPAEFAGLRQQHSEVVLTLLQAGVAMRLVRRHRLDDPRIPNELRAVLVRAVREQQRTVWGARHSSLSDSQDWMTRLWKGAIRDCPLALESPHAPPPVRRNIIPSQAQPITIDLIRKQVSDYFRLRELPLDQGLKVRSNKRIVTFPRQVAMYLARELTPASLLEIGRQFGGKHHTTVLHSIGKIEQMRRSDKNLDYTIERLAEMLRHQ